MSKIYEEKHGHLSSDGHELCRKIQKAMEPIVEFCIEKGFDLRLASHRVMVDADSMFTTKILERRLAGPKKS